jgi:hypothetical protein
MHRLRQRQQLCVAQSQDKACRQCTPAAYPLASTLGQTGQEDSKGTFTLMLCMHKGKCCVHACARVHTGKPPLPSVLMQQLNILKLKPALEEANS